MIKIQDDDEYMINECRALLEKPILRFDKKIYEDILDTFSKKYVRYKRQVLNALYNFILFHNTECTLDIEVEKRIKLSELKNIYANLNEEGNIDPVITNLETINKECIEYKLNPLKLKHRIEKNESEGIDNKTADKLLKDKEELIEVTKKAIEESRKTYLSAESMYEVLDAASNSKLSDEKIVESLKEYYKFSLLCNSVIGITPFADAMYKNEIIRTLKSGLLGKRPIEDGIELMKGFTDDVFFYREGVYGRRSLINKCKRTMMLPEFRFTGDALKSVIAAAETSKLDDEVVIAILKEIYVFMIFQGTAISLDSTTGINTKLKALKNIEEALEGTKPFDETLGELEELNKKMIQYRMDPTLLRSLKEDADSNEQ